MTDESPELVREWLLKAKPAYPIAVTGGAFESFINVPHFPFCAVIGPDGNLAYAGNVGMEEGALDGALDKTKKAPLWPKSLSKVTKLMMGDPIKAYGELKKLRESGKVSPEDQPFTEGFVAYLEGRAQGALDAARQANEGGHVFRAVKAIEIFATAQPPFPTSADSAQLLKELQALPDFKKELAGGEAFAEAEMLEKDHEFLDAFNAYKSIYKKYADTRIAANARTKAESLHSDGMPGFASTCDPCRKAKRACDKHRKEVKL